MITEKGVAAYLKRDIAVTVHGRLASTNTEAKRMYEDGCRKMSLVIANSQDGGRGRMGRSFFSPNGGLYMSLLIPEVLDAEMSLRITTAAAVAVCRAVEAFTERRAGIKWVNDVYVDGKKVCGILTEGGFTADGRLSHAVLGIGVNLTPPCGGFPEDIRDRAGAVFESLSDGDACRFAAYITDSFMELFENGLDAAIYLDEYRSRSVLVGRRVDVMHIHDGGSVPAEVMGIDGDFGLCVRYDDGSCETLSSGDVSLRL